MLAEKYKKAHEAIVQLFEYTEELITSVENKQVKNPELHLAAIQDLVDEVEISADELSEEFCKLADSKQKVKKNRIEASFRRIFVAIDGYNKRLQQESEVVAEKIRAITDPIVEQMKLHVEHVVALFLQFVDLGITRFMHAKQVEEMKKREPIVAHMLHSMSVNPS